MTKLSQLISLPVFSIYECKLEGTVENALLNLEKNKIEFLIIYNEKENLKKLITYGDIYSVSENGASIKNSSYVNLYESMELATCKCFNPINANAFKVDGTFLGRVTDVELNKSRISSFIIDEKNEVPANQILTFNNELVVIKNSQRQRVSTFKYNEIKATILDTKVSILTPSPAQKENIITPKKAVVNYNFLINRKVTKDIISVGGEVLIKRDALITLSIINLAKQFGKIKELTLFSK